MKRLPRRISFRLVTVLLAVLGHVQIVAHATADDESVKPTQLEPPAESSAKDITAEALSSPAKQADNADPPGLTRVSKDYPIWVDTKRKLVVVDGTVCLREGQLEMFACPAGTKEHESVISVKSKAKFVHAALLLVGAKPGSPAKYDLDYTPAHGTTVDILVLWKDKQGVNHKVRAQEWIKDLRTGKAMTHSWVFAGSGFWVDPVDGTKYYNAEAGDLICVSNFTTATLDLPIQSSKDNASLLFTAFTEKIPALKTKVRLVLIPRLTDKSSKAKAG